MKPFVQPPKLPGANQQETKWRESLGYLRRMIVSPDGWTPIVQSWTYASASTVNVPSDATLLYPMGAKIRFKQAGAWKYFYVVGVAERLLTLAAGSDYAVTTDDISNIYMSVVPAPLGFPAAFNFDAAPTGFSSVPTNINYRFRCDGRLCLVEYEEGTSGTSNAATFTVSAPVPSANIANMNWRGAILRGTDNNLALTVPGVALITAGSSTITLYASIPTGAWTAASQKRACFQLIYEF